MIGIYVGIFAASCSSCLSPFIEGFLVSLKPLVAAVFLALQLLAEERLARLPTTTMWERVPRLGRYIFNSLFISIIVTADRAAHRRCRRPMPSRVSSFRFRGPLLGAFLAVNMFSGAVLLDPAVPADALDRRAQHLFRHDRAGRRLPDPDGDLAAARLFDAHPEGAGRGRLGRWRKPSLHLRRVILPLAMPGITVVAIATFIGAYAQQFIFALTFNSKSEYMPLDHRPVRLLRPAGGAVERADGGEFRRHLAGAADHRVPAALSRRRPHRRCGERISNRLTRNGA